MDLIDYDGYYACIYEQREYKKHEKLEEKQKNIKNFGWMRLGNRAHLQFSACQQSLEERVQRYNWNIVESGVKQHKHHQLGIFVYNNQFMIVTTEHFKRWLIVFSL